MNWQQIQEAFYNCLDFWKLLELIKQHQIAFTILGNPFHLTDEICRRLKEYGCEKYQLSIDGLRKTHDWFRKPGSLYMCQCRGGILPGRDRKTVYLYQRGY